MALDQDLKKRVPGYLMGFLQLNVNGRFYTLQLNMQREKAQCKLQESGIVMGELNTNIGMELDQG